MSKIHILKEEISNRIAAGEVIERPSSVVKELVDNAIDAGSTRILINIVNGGSSLIQVTDNGSGMDNNDALMCLEAHATSKIRDVDDLERISTFGFRGEAMPSIASVSRFTILTRQHSSIEGTRVEVEGGTIRNVQSTGCPPGTTISVKNLFFNVPARKKFLRSRSTEEGHIQEIVLLLALSRLDLFLELKFNGRTVFSVPPTEDIRTRAALLFGRSMVNEMIPVNFTDSGITITGLIGRPGLTRRNRKEQRTFVNGRPVESASLYNGLKDAYFGLIEKGQFCPCLLYYILDPAQVDINVHPAKREVRFNNDRLISTITSRAAKAALFPGEIPKEEESTENFDTPTDFISSTPSEELETSFEIDPISTSKAQSFVPNTDRVTMPTPDTSHFESPSKDQSSEPTAPSKRSFPEPVPLTHKVTNAPQVSASPKANITDDTFGELTVLGLHQKRYIITSTPTGLVLVNVRAAQERILFEKLLSKTRETISQPLLLPIHLEFPQADTAIIKKHLPEILKLGFEMEHFGGLTYIISSVPADFPQENVNGVINDLIDQLREASHTIKRQRDHYLIKSVCQSAVRHYKELKAFEMEHLLKELSHCQMPYSCPQEKPTLLNFSNNELGKRFGR